MSVVIEDPVAERVSKWLGFLPSGWTGARLLQVAEAWTSNVDKHAVEGQTPVRLCNYVDVYKNQSIVESIDFMAATAMREQIKKFRIRAGDTLITKDSETADDIGVPAFVEYEADDLICGYHLAIVRPDQRRIFPRFLYWTLDSEPIARQWGVTAAGVTRVGIRSTDLNKVTIPLPPLEEQRAIADYLDQETAQVDTLVAKQEEFIGLLRERRISAVDAILDGLKWVVPLSTQTALIQTGPFGSQLKSTEYVSRGVPLINPSHIGPDGCLPDPTVSVSKEKAMQLSRHALRSGDLIVARRGELARSAVIHENERGFLCGTGSAIVRPIPTRISTDYLNLIYRSRRNSDALSLSSNGSTMDSVNAQTIGALRIPVPDLVNQRRIVDQAKHQTTRIDALIAKAEEHIALAKERRSALITAAVTGQFDVRTAQKGARA